jgi:hypothetical protein
MRIGNFILTMRRRFVIYLADRLPNRACLCVNAYHYKPQFR